MTNFDPIPAPGPLSTPLDPDGGLLCLSVYWRPNPDEPNPEMPGQKLSMTSYIPLRPRAACLCGRGKSYGACCRRRRYWYPICPNPGLKGDSLLAWQSATFSSVDGAAIRARLFDAVQLRCVEDSPTQSCPRAPAGRVDQGREARAMTVWCLLPASPAPFPGWEQEEWAGVAVHRHAHISPPPVLQSRARGERAGRRGPHGGMS